MTGDAEGPGRGVRGCRVLPRSEFPLACHSNCGFGRESVCRVPMRGNVHGLFILESNTIDKPVQVFVSRTSNYKVIWWPGWEVPPSRQEWA